MLIPKSVTVGKKKYAIKRREKSADFGSICYNMGIIYIAKAFKEDYLRPITSAEMSEAFWHEITHAILKDMGDTKNNNEQFVTEFSSRLNVAVLTAKF